MEAAMFDDHERGVEMSGKKPTLADVNSYFATAAALTSFFAIWG
jgi:hypothetical protein